jgi:heptosyltransferase-3
MMTERTSQAKCKKVLIYRLGSLGDTVVALPAFHLIAQAFPDADRRLLTNFPVATKAPPAASILNGTGLVHSYFRYAVGTRSPRELLSLWWQLVRWRPQVLVYLAAGRGVAAARRDATFFRLCGIQRLIGIPDTEDMQQHRWQQSAQALEFEASRLTRNIAELGEPQLDSPASWNLHLTPAEHARADQALLPLANRPILAVSVGTKIQTKDWGRDNWRTLLTQLGLLYPNFALALCGSPDEAEASEFAAGGWRDSSQSPVVNLCGHLTPRESAAAFSRARLFIGHDSGPMHLAAAVQTPCVAIFAARNKPRVWFPYGSQHRVLYHQTDCWGCNLVTCTVERKKCIMSITVDEVLTQVRAILDEPLHLQTLLN